MAGMSREWGVGVEVGVSGVKLLTSRAKSLLTCGRTEQINALWLMGIRLLTVRDALVALSCPSLQPHGL